MSSISTFILDNTSSSVFSNIFIIITRMLSFIVNRSSMKSIGFVFFFSKYIISSSSSSISSKISSFVTKFL